MADVMLDLADALTEKLVELLGWDARRQYQFIQDRKQLGEKFHVFVFPNTDELELMDGEGNNELIDINIAVQKAVNVADVEAVDACVFELRKLKNLYGVGGALRDEELAGCAWRGVLDNSPVWNPDVLLNGSEFRSVVTVGYRTDQ